MAEPLGDRPLLMAITPPDAARHPKDAARWLEGLGAGLRRAGQSLTDATPPVIVQVRDKSANDQEVLHLLALIRRALPDVRVLLNGTHERALLLGFDGHHRNAAVQEPVRRATPPGVPTLVGQSSHSLSEARRAVRCGVDYVVFGPVYDTPAKRAFGPPQGLDALRSIAESVSRPVLAIGGIDGDRAEAAVRAGAAGVAAIRAAGDPIEVQRMLRALLRSVDSREGRRPQPTSPPE